jgi:DNA-binding response OmpR family regulator
LRVLIVDDNADAVDSLAWFLKAQGHEVFKALDGLGGVAAAADCKPDAVLLDIGLPGIDGYEVARRLRVQESFASTPLIAVTGFGQEEDRQRSRDAGFDYHLVKPVDPDRLNELLRQCRPLAAG